MNRSSFHIRKEHASSSGSAPAPRNVWEYNGQNLQNFKARHTQSQGSIVQRGSWDPVCGRYGGNNTGKCRDG